MLTWTIERLTLQLKFDWKIARNTSQAKVNFFIKVKAKGFEGIGEVAPNIRYQETPEKILVEFGMLCNNELTLVRNVEGLQRLLQDFEICYALRMGLEAAYLDWYCKKNKITLANYLRLPPTKSFQTAFTIPMMEIGTLNSFFLQNDLHRFAQIKVKIDAQSGFETIKEIDNITDQPLLIDANEAWTDVEDLLLFIDKIKRYNIVFLEQPLPADMDEAYFYLKKNCPLTLMADESVTHRLDLVKIKRQFDGINMKLMKAGGLLNGMKLLKEAKLIGLKTMIGCMVETSLGISYGALFSSICDYVDLDSFLYIENEPAGILKEEKGVISWVE
jgi:L-Ala-D/L-Glu epimerase